VTATPFRERTAVLLAVAVGASFLGWVLLLVFGSDPLPQGPGADGYSRRAIGHLALVRTLEELDVPVLLSRWDSGRRAGRDDVLLVLEPTLDGGDGARTEALHQMLRQARKALVVLPKWAAHPEARWVRDLPMRSAADVQQVLDEVMDGRLERRPEPAAIDASALGSGAPTLGHVPVQWIVDTEMTRLATSGERTLLGEMVGAGWHRIVLADPDVLSNAGLHRPGNVEFVLAAIERLRRGRGTVVVDETLHGYERVPSLAREALTPPLVFSIGHVALGLLVFVWAAGARFGAPLERPPPFEPGTRGLLRTTAELLRAGGHVREALPRYLAAVVEHVRAALRAPPLEEPALEHWLDRIAAARGARHRLDDLRADVRAAAGGPPSSARALAAALKIDRWRQEVLDGTQ
jgi:hypothetical protein